ncbi:MAG: NAD-dependent epimerase/dehydratase family protein [Caldilineaceae bacterium]|nr:NAD-dependent epimerase/dehydratase family protein [Caldilineaceae bacterium]
MSALQILLIGGSGFVSGTLAQRALAAGHHVAVVTRGQRAVAAGVTPIIADRRDTPSLQRALAAYDQPWDLVVDCIGYEASDAQQDIELFRDRARQLVFISTDFVYDPSRRDFPQTEANEHYLTDTSYGGKKRQCELTFGNSDTGSMAWTIVRPCHIYGPGSLLGCLPLHGRDPGLLTKLQQGEPLQLIGGGHFLQQPIFAADLAETILSCAGNTQCHGQIYLTAGPDIIESRRYYEIIAAELGVTANIQEVSVSQFLAEHPDRHSFACHRIYDLSKLHHHGLHVPATPISEGLRQQVASLRAT